MSFICQQTRFLCLGNLSDLENAISNKEKAVALTVDGQQKKPGYLSNLGTAFHTRFQHLGNLLDLENAISNTEKAVGLMDDRYPEKYYLSISELLSCSVGHSVSSELFVSIDNFRATCAIDSSLHVRD